MGILAQRIRLKRLLFIGTLMIVACIFYLFNVSTPLYCDDYKYCFSFYDDSRISSVSAILRSMGTHYEVMNGRLVTHFLAQFYLMFDEWVFNAANTAVFLGLGILIYWYSGFGWGVPRSWMLALVFILLYWCTPFFGESYLWTAASVTYLHGTVLVLLFLLPYWEHFCNPCKKQPDKLASWLAAFGNLIFGFCAGAASETVSLAMIVIMLSLLCVFYVRKELRGWMLTGLLGSLSGFVFMLAAPGNAGRMASNQVDTGIFFWIKNFVGMSWSLLVYLWPLLLLGASLLVLLVVSRRTYSLKDNILFLLPVFILLLGAAASYYSGIVSGGLPLRAYSGVTIFGVIICGSILSRLTAERKPAEKLMSVFLAVAVLVTLASCWQTQGLLKEVRQQHDEREAGIRQQIASGQTTLLVPHITSDSRYSCFYEAKGTDADNGDNGANGDVCADPTHWTNQIFAYYWGVDAVEIIP